MNTLFFAAGILLASAHVAAVQRENAPLLASADQGVAQDPGDSLYRAAQQALSDNDNRRAAALFKEYVDRYPRSGRAGEALYWRAWALYHSGVDLNSRPDLEAATAALQTLSSTYPRVNVRDAADLRVRIQSARAKLGDRHAAADVTSTAQQLDTVKGCPGEEDDMRIAALQGLMSMDSESAMPLLKQVLARRGACTESLRKQAVFILSQKRSADVTTMLLDVARNDPSSEVRGDAIQWLSQSRSPAAVPALDSVLFSAKDDDLRNKAIFALSQQRSDAAIQSLRRAAEDPKMSDELRGQAVFWLGQNRLVDLDFFRALFKKTTSEEIHSNIFQAISQMRSPEASRWLLDLARDKAVDIESRKNAIFWASQRSAIDFDALSQLYDDMRGQGAMQDQIMFVLSQRREPAAVDKLMSIARSDPDTERRKQAIFWLGQKARQDPRINAFLLELINK